MTRLLSNVNISNQKIWIVIGVGVAGVVILAEAHRRRLKARNTIKEDFGAFIERFEILPFPQPPPPAARLPLSGLTFAFSDIFDVKGYVTGFGCAEWRKTHDVAGKTAFAVTAMLKNGATCLGKTVMDELGFGITGENAYYGTPTNPKLPSHLPGGSSSGSAVAVASELVDFALGTDTCGCIRIPAAFCGIFGYKPSHGIVSMVGVLPNSQSLDTVGCFAKDPSVLHRVGHALLQLKPLEPKRARRLIIADDLFQLSVVPTWKTVDIVSRVTEKLSGYETSKHMNLGNYISEKVPILKEFCEESNTHQKSISCLKALSSAMLLLQRYEFKGNHEEWINSAKPKLVMDVADASPEKIKALYKVRSEMRNAFQSLLKDDGILVIPTVADPPLKRNSKKASSSEVHDRAYALLSISTMSGCCQVALPFGESDGYPVSVSFISSHGTDKYLLDTVLDMYASLQEEVQVASASVPLPTTNGSLDASELLKEKGNAAYKGKQWNKALSYYSEAIKVNELNPTYYCNRAAAYLELGCFKQAGEDCTQAISLDKKNVKAYLRRGTARESLLFYKEALQVWRLIDKISMASKLKLARCLSFTASTDWFYRYFFTYSGLRSVTTDFGDGTIMHCWTPKIRKTTKPDILLVHGFGANAMWQYGDVLRQLISKFNVYVPDLLFFGRSYTTRPERTEQFQAQCVMRLMEMLEVRRMSLVGISYGGFVGYSMAVQFPSALDKLVLCCSGVALEEKDMESGLFQVSDVEEAANILVPQTPEKLRDLMNFAFASPVKVVPTCFLSDYIDVMCTDHVKEKKELIHAILQDRNFSNLPKITQPTLIIWGDLDKIFPLELAYRLQRHIENSQLEVIKHAGHALNVEKPREFAKHLKKFLIASDPSSDPPRFIHRRFWSS